MATLVDNANLVRTAAASIDAAIRGKGGVTAGGLLNAAAAVEALETGVGSPPATPTLAGMSGQSYKLNSVEGADSYKMVELKIRGGGLSESADVKDITSYVLDGSYVYCNNYTVHAIFAVKDGVPSQPRLVGLQYYCLLGGTSISLADGTEKPIERVTYDDELLVWDFDHGTMSRARPCWIKKRQVSGYYFRNTLSDGTVLLTTGRSSTGWGHRMFDETRQRFVYTTQSVGDEIRTLRGPKTHVSCARVEGLCEYYNVITERHLNLFANGILTSCSLSNGLGDIRGAMFVAGSVAERHAADEFAGIPRRFVEGLRLREQRGDAETLKAYVNNLISCMEVPE